jgi:hypothetical protein
MATTPFPLSSTDGLLLVSVDKPSVATANKIYTYDTIAGQYWNTGGLLFSQQEFRVNGSGTISLLVSPETLDYKVRTYYATSTNAFMSINGRIAASASYSSFSIPSPVNAFIGKASGGGAERYVGLLQELIFYSASQATNKNYIESNINAYYNVFTTSSISTENAFVSTWYDQSGNNRHATQTATGSQPLIVSSGSLVTENGKPALDFNGTSNYFNLPNIDVTTPFSSFAVGRRSSNGTEILFYGGSGVTHGLSTDNKYYLQKSTGYLQSNNTDTTNQQILLSGIATATTQSQFKNSSEITSTFISATIQTTVNKLGYYTGASPFYFNGKYQELSLYLTDQSSNRPLIENNINNYYNIYTGSNHGFVARWYDQSGNNRHATQTATGSQPMIVESGSIINTNSRPSLKFDGVNDSLGINYNASAGTIAVQSVQKINSASGMSILIQEGGPHLYFQWVNTPSTFANYYNGQYGETLFSTNQILHSFYMQTGGGGFFQNGISTITRTQGGSGASSVPMRIGAYAEGSSHADSNHQEFIVYQTAQSSNRGPIEYNINNYYNIYPQTSSFATSSFTIQATPTTISGAINNKLTSGIPSSGPLGLITVSRTGSNSLTIARNGVTSSFAVPASGALSTGIYLGAINNNGLALGNSPLNLSFASVGTGLTGAELVTYKNLVNTLQTNLGRFDLDALSFINSTQTLNITQQNAINTLVLDLKGFSLWDKMKAIYPFVGGTANTHKFNLKDPRDLDVAYRLTFSGTWTHNISGSQPTDSRADSYIVPPTDLERDSVHLSIYSQTSAVTSGADWAAQMNTFYFGPLVAASLYATINNGELNTGGTPYSSARGLLIATRVNSNTVNFYYNTNLLRTSTVNSAAGSSTQTLLLGGFVDGRYNSNKMWSFGTVGSGLSTIDITNLYTAVQRFQTTLGRQV